MTGPSAERSVDPAAAAEPHILGYERGRHPTGPVCGSTRHRHISSERGTEVRIRRGQRSTVDQLLMVGARERTNRTGRAAALRR
jgi:hypothetical protein